MRGVKDKKHQSHGFADQSPHATGECSVASDPNHLYDQGVMPIGDTIVNETRRPKLTENLCRMNYERSLRRRGRRWRRRFRFTMRDLMWFVFCAALASIIGMDNIRYRSQIEQIRSEARQTNDRARQQLADTVAWQASLRSKQEELTAKEKQLRVKEEELEDKTRQWQERVGQLTSETPR